MQDVKKYGCGSKFLWGNKRNTYKHVQKHKGKIYGQYRAILNSSKDTDTKALKLMLLFMSIPGLGAVKAGFVCQLAAGLVGCIDLHNIRLYGINENMLKISNKIKSKELYAAKVSKYISVCHNIGTEKLWNTWCEHVAKQPNKFNSAAEVSAAHVEYLLV